MCQCYAQPTFIEPEVLPSLIADKVACPAVSNLMSDHIHLYTGDISPPLGALSAGQSLRYSGMLLPIGMCTRFGMGLPEIYRLLEG